MYRKTFRDALDQDTINMIGEAIISKERNLQYYQWVFDNIRLMDLSPIPNLTTTQVSGLITLLQSIIDDELKHTSLLQNLYFRLTGNYTPLYTGTFVPPKGFISALKYALEENLVSIERLKLIMNKLQDPDYKELISSIITDELNHTNTYYSLLHQFEIHNNNKQG
ncbi:ferritin-like domain-containing protein [Clostridioides mangenotii]|uniref:ferritin-like domain-containing protein n=1 Tax=Metaclostridioides mangenotii TaxID=1540 RepID=UPI001C11AC46|nr:ferritin-like domain-containing protein [Clostridioides mangenotii]MBU5308398.1 ferritin-like domain-containing protein [Clostridioides mangenotii]MCR1953367.1 ferritin-like domain-containing protein [Clostridioides mangenotii]